ncbi:MAG: hypothetical protein WCT08_05575 [Patescibacteria group bacterium]
MESGAGSSSQNTASPILKKSGPAEKTGPGKTNRMETLLVSAKRVLAHQQDERDYRTESEHDKSSIQRLRLGGRLSDFPITNPRWGLQGADLNVFEYRA